MSVTDITNIDLTPEDKAAFQPVGARLTRLVAITTSNLVHAAVDKPVPDAGIDKSKAAKLRDAYEQASQRLNSAEDHLRTILTIITSATPVPQFALFTLVRAAAIPIVHARYLLDPSISETDRLGRGLIARLENQKQLRKVERNEAESPDNEDAGDEGTTADASLSPDDLFAERVEHFRKRPRAPGFSLPPNRHQQLIVFPHS